MQPKTLSFDEKKRVEYYYCYRKEITVEPIEDGLHITASSYNTTSMLGFGGFDGTLDIHEAEKLIKALTDALEEVTRPVSAVYLDKNHRAAPGVETAAQLQGKTVVVCSGD